MRTPVLDAAGIELLPDWLVEYYELDLLWAGDFDGAARWIIGRFGDHWFGPLIGPAFTDAVFLQWPLIPEPIWA